MGEEDKVLSLMQVEWKCNHMEQNWKWNGVQIIGVRNILVGKSVIYKRGCWDEEVMNAMKLLIGGHFFGEETENWKNIED